ncbi:MAG: Asp-tRNA(Asn)/Glu-tRNA(Gln) amidotransferase subunit GatA [Hahellaceae bacterium]|nr:Asp-tRNA(Asn)/Glu-tRNA(Gln) amidotransferase subunit GatA [Hahellaceae bacterium]
MLDGLDKRQFSSEELTRHLLTKAEASQPHLNSFITLCHDQAISAARAADEARTRGENSLLLGIPVAHKDAFCTAGIRTTSGSRMLSNFIPPYESTVSRKFKDAGAVCLGKTNMDEFAMGSSNENSFFGAVRNPWDLSRVPGGSSGGSAAAVAAGLVPAATGTDTGGSIRQPAAFCGISGLKPTYGRVSRLGMIAYASSLDQGGPLAHTVEDLALLLKVMAGLDENDSTSADAPVPDYAATLATPLQGLRIGLPREVFSETAHPEAARALQAAIAELEKLGATLVDITLPHTALSVPAYYVIAPAEASTNLSRFDGVRYGHRCDNPTDLEDLYSRTRAEGFGKEVQRRILIGTYALSAGYYDAYYRQAQRIRRLIKNDFVAAFSQVDTILTPVTPGPAFGLGAKTSDPVAMYLEDIYTVPTSLAGLPGLSIPCGFAEGMPIGMQLIGNYFDEARLLNLGHQFQLHTDWHTRRPDVTRITASAN